MVNTKSIVKLAVIFLLTGCGGEPFGTQWSNASGSAGALGGAPVEYDAGAGGSGGAVIGSGGATDEDSGSAGGTPSASGGEHGAGGVAEDGGGSHHACLTDLSGVGTGDFRIAFTITTTAHADVALLSQRIGCDQSSMLWGVSLDYNGHVDGATADGLTEHWVATMGSNSVVDGKPHAIVFARTSGKIWISRDGVVDSIPIDDPYSLGALPPLRIGTDDCPGFWSAQKAGAVLSNVCVSK